VTTLRLSLLLLAGLLGACEAPNAPPTATWHLAAIRDRGAAPEAPEAWTPLGLQIEEVPQAAQRALGIASGVMVTKVRAPANRSRILPGDVIVGVNQTPIASVEEFNRLIAGQGHRTIGLLVRRADADLYIPLELGSAAAGTDPENALGGASRGAGAPTPEESFKAGRPTGRPLRT
jgi:hypothetical protein